MWSEQSAKDKLPFEQKAAKLKEKYEKVSKSSSELLCFLVCGLELCGELVLHVNNSAGRKSNEYFGHS